MTPGAFIKNVKADIIQECILEIFCQLRCSQEIYEPVIQGLIETSLRGVDTHGVRLIPHYVNAALEGRINLKPIINLRETSASTAVLDANHTYGVAAATKAMKKSIELAQRSGIGCTVVFNSSHFAAAAIYALQAARQNMIGISLTHSDSLVLPYGGQNSFLGTNPVCFAAPSEGEDPFCLDMSTSVVSWNKILQHRFLNQMLEPDWAADSSGKVTLDPRAAVGILPLSGYKGYGLALMVEILCSLLSGMPYGPHIPRMYPLTEDKRCLGHFLLAIDIARFQDPAVFKRRMRDLLGELRKSPPVEGFDNVKVAGDPEKEAYQKRSQEGIPLSLEEIKCFRDVIRKLNIKEPSFLS